MNLSLQVKYQILHLSLYNRPLKLPDKYNGFNYILLDKKIIRKNRIKERENSSLN